jgi:MFS family permease
MESRTGVTAEQPSPLAQQGGEQSPRAAALAWFGLSVLLMTTLFALVVRQMLSLIAPSLQTTLGFTDLQIGMLQGLGMAIFACVASYPMGWLADRFGRRLILAIGVVIWSAATFCSAFQGSFGGLFACTIGIAIGEAGLAPIVYAMIPDLFPERQRSTANFIFYGASLLGAGAGMALAGALLQWLAGSQHDFPAWLAGIDTWRMAMMAVALPGPLFLLLVATMPLGKRLPFQRQESASADPTMVATA